MAVYLYVQVLNGTVVLLPLQVVSTTTALNRVNDEKNLPRVPLFSPDVVATGQRHKLLRLL